MNTSLDVTRRDLASEVQAALFEWPAKVEVSISGMKRTWVDNLNIFWIYTTLCGLTVLKRTSFSNIEYSRKYFSLNRAIHNDSHPGCYLKKLLLKCLQNAHENICAGVFFK